MDSLEDLCIAKSSRSYQATLAVEDCSILTAICLAQHSGPFPMGGQLGMHLRIRRIHLSMCQRDLVRNQRDRDVDRMMEGTMLNPLATMLLSLLNRAASSVLR